MEKSKKKTVILCVIHHRQNPSESTYVFLQFQQNRRMLLTDISNSSLYVECEVLDAEVMKSSIFRDITPCSSLRVIGRFGGICRRHLQDRRISRARNQHEIRWCTSFTLVSSLIFWPWRWRQHILLKRRLTFNGLHGIIFLKIELFTILYLSPCFSISTSKL
jgi:hypothetical protein